jgi:hypothetical protein
MASTDGTSARPLPAGSARAGRLATVGGAAIAMTAIAAALWRGLGAAPGGDAGSAPAALEGLGATLAAISSASADAPLPPASSEGSAEQAAPSAPRRLLIAADAPIRDLRVGERRVPIQHPRQTLALDLSAEEAGEPATITATSADGRRIVASVPPEDTLELRFPPRATRARPPGEDLPTLIPNPYRPR